MIRFLVLSFAVATLASTATRAAADDAQALGWLAGHWAGEKDGVSMEEHWTRAAGGTLLGVHRDVQSGRTLSWEFMRIATTEEGTFYFASPRAAPATAFKLVEAAGRRAVFENLQHDFPQRILYWLDDEGALHARIEGPLQGRAVAEEWVWRRQDDCR